MPLNRRDKMEIRCKKCNRLFFRIKGPGGKIEIKCPKCGYEQTITIAARQGDLLHKEICLDKP